MFKTFLIQPTFATVSKNYDPLTTSFNGHPNMATTCMDLHHPAGNLISAFENETKPLCDRAYYFVIQRSYTH